eukprot:CAMPEP_0203817142 /NCGR_PEP_ID=MMETSP0115-20131106/18338_1 /ASSEMBLY_ACC=CAM_ASM_000227 /TAXON_ID=33651 /ORGANISM="Bicosoecid sp, Strain ms1" /LENGTH=466 /DNA_ID=CAMNT_0050726059 /DNA_START=164 /DNA_END=1564 /DNA_ORIENTATION=+
MRRGGCVGAVAALALVAGASAALDATQTTRIPLLHGEDMSNVVYHSDGVWLIGVVNDAQCGEPCEVVKETLQAAHEKAGDLVNLATIDAFQMIEGDDGEMVSLQEAFNITTLPSMLLYSYGPKVMLKGIKMDAQTVLALAGQGPKAFLKYLRNFIPSAVSRVRQFGLTKFLTYEEPHLPRVLLIHAKKKTPLVFMRLSLQFDRRAVFGEVVASDVDADFLLRFGVGDADDELPRMLVSPPGETVDAEAESFADWEVYEEGDNSYPAVSRWLMGRLPEVPIPHVRSFDGFESACVAKGGICFVAFLPGDGDERDDLLDAYRYVAGRSYSHANLVAANQFTISKLPVHFAWVDGDKQAAMMAAFGITAPPGVVGVNPRKKLFSAYRGAFDPDGVHDFILRMMDGKEQVDSYDSLPAWRDEAAEQAAASASRKAKKGKGKGDGAGKKKKKKGTKKKKKKAAAEADGAEL